MTRQELIAALMSCNPDDVRGRLSENADAILARTAGDADKIALELARMGYQAERRHHGASHTR